MASRPTCYSIAVSALITLHCQKNSPLYENFENDPAKVDAFLQKILIESNHLLLETVSGPTVRSLLQSMRDFLGLHFTDSFLVWLETAATSVDAFVDLMGTVLQALLPSNNAPPNVNQTSANGMYLRAVCLGYDILSFDSVGLLWTEFAKQVESIRQNGLDAEDTDANPSVFSWPLSSSQMEDALQSEIRELALHKTHDFAKRDAQLQTLLEHNPELPSAHFLHFWYSLQAGDRQAAIDALHQYLDTAMVQLENTDPDGTGNNTTLLQFAAVLAAAFWDSTGDRSLSLAATEEAVRVAQQSGDAACVAFALGWLGLHDKTPGSGKSSSQALIRQCVERATQNNLRSLTAGASLLLATQNADQPVEAWSHWLRALTDGSSVTDMSSGLDRPVSTNHLESGDEALAILARQRLVAAGLYDAFGQAGMSEMMSQIVLECHTDQLLSQDIAIAVQNIARCSLLGFSPDDMANTLHKSLQQHLEVAVAPQSSAFKSSCLYATALRKLVNYRDLFRLPSRGAFQLEMMLLLHEWAVRRGDLTQAEGLGIALQCHLCPRLPNYEEIKIDISAQRALLLSRLGKWDEAKALVRTLVAQCKEEHRKNRRGRLLLQLVALHLESTPGEFTAALPYLMECLSMSEHCHMNGVHACALVLLGQVHLRMRNPRKALATARAALSPVLQHEHVWMQGETFLTLADCHMHLADDASGAVHDCVKCGIKMLEQAIELFARCHDCVRLKSAYYMLARLFDRLPDCKKQRDDAAEKFVKVSKHLAHALGPNSDTSLSRLDDAEVLEQLIRRPIPIY